MKKHNLAYNNKARQIKQDDFKKYDYIFGMDDENIDDLKGLFPKDGTAKILLFGDFDPEGDRIIRDPYYVCLCHLNNFKISSELNRSNSNLILKIGFWCKWIRKGVSTSCTV